jgi:hypothetical protein
MSSTLGSVRPHTLARRAVLNDRGSVEGRRAAREACFRPVGFLIELTSDCPKRRFPSRRRFSIGLDTRRLSRSGCLPRGRLRSASGRAASMRTAS